MRARREWVRDLCTDDTVAWEDRAVVGHKNGWCVSDTDTYTDRRKFNRHGGRCGKQTPRPERGLFAFSCGNMVQLHPALNLALI